MTQMDFGPTEPGEEFNPFGEEGFNPFGEEEGVEIDESEVTLPPPREFPKPVKPPVQEPEPLIEPDLPDEPVDFNPFQEVEPDLGSEIESVSEPELKTDFLDIPDIPDSGFSDASDVSNAIHDSGDAKEEVLAELVDENLAFGKQVLELKAIALRIIEPESESLPSLEEESTLTLEIESPEIDDLDVFDTPVLQDDPVMLVDETEPDIEDTDILDSLDITETALELEPEPEFEPTPEPEFDLSEPDDLSESHIEPESEPESSSDSHGSDSALEFDLDIGIAASNEDEEFDMADSEDLSESESEPESSTDSHGSDSDMEFDLDLGIASSDEDEEFDMGDSEDLSEPESESSSDSHGSDSDMEFDLDLGIASSDEDEEFDSSDFEGLSESEPESEPESSSDSHGSDSDMEFDLDLGIASSDEDEEFDTGDFEELPDPMQQEMLAEGYLLEEADEVEPVTETVSLLELSEDLDERKEVLEFIESQGILDTLSQSVAEVEEFEPTPKVEPVVAESIQVQNEGFNYFDIASRLSEETLRALKNIEAVTWNPPQPELVEEPEVESTVLPDWLQTQLVELSSMKQAQEMAARLHLEHRANLDQIVEVLREGGFAHLILLAELLLSSEEPVDEIETIALYHSALKVMPEALETLRLEILLRLWEMAPLNQQLILNIASLYRKLNQNQQRESFLISAIEKMIDHARFREARYLFQLCTKEGFESEIFCRVGVRLYSGCQDDESLLLYLDRVEMLHGSHIDWELQRKDALIRMGKLVEALHSLKQCLTLSDEPVPVLEEIVSLMRRLAKRQEVLPYINQLLSLDPHNSLAEEMLAWAKPVEVKPVTIETPVLAEDSLRNLESRLEAMLEKKLSSLKVGREIPVQSEVIHEFEEKSIEESHLPNETLVSDAINFEEFESSNQDKQEHVKRDLDWEEVRLELPPTILRKLKEMEEWERKLSVNHDLSQEDSLIILGNLQELILGAEKMPEKIRRRYCDLGRNLSRNLADPMLAFFWTSEFQKLS